MKLRTLIKVGAMAICAQLAVTGVTMASVAADTANSASGSATYTAPTSNATSTAAPTNVPTNGTPTTSIQGVGTPTKQTTSVNGVPVTTYVYAGVQEPLNTVLSETTTITVGNNPTQTCNWSTEFGTYLSVAYGKIRLDQNNCNTTSEVGYYSPPNTDDGLSNVVVTGANNGYYNTGGISEATAFHNWYQSQTVQNFSVLDENIWICLLDDGVNTWNGVTCVNYEFDAF